MMKKVYICAPLEGDVAVNLQQANRYAEYAMKCGVAPVAPHFYSQFMNYSKPRQLEAGVKAGHSLLWFCDELWIFGEEITKGMNAEIQFCKTLNIKTRKVRASEIKKVLGG